jgi:predicted CopG family antitoxin
LIDFLQKQVFTKFLNLSNQDYKREKSKILDQALQCRELV